MTIYRRLAYITLTIILLVLVVLPTVLYALLSTSTGSAWAIQQAQRFMPAELSYQAFSGTLTDTFRLTQFHYDSDSLSLNFSEIEMTWQPESLFNQRFEITQLTLGSGNIRVRSGAAEQPQQPITAITDIELSLPVDIELQRLRLQESWLFLPNAPQQQIAMNVAAEITKSGQLTVSALNVEHQYASLNASLSAAIDYPFQFSGQIDLLVKSPDYPTTQLNLSAQGDIEELTADYSIADSIALTGRLEAAHLLDQLTWSSKLNVNNTKINQWLQLFAQQSSPSLRLDGSVKAQGTRQYATLSPQLTLSTDTQQAIVTGQTNVNATALDIAQLGVELKGIVDGNTKVSGRLPWQDNTDIELSLATQDLSYQHLSANSQLNAKGPLSALTIDGDVELMSPHFDALNISLSGRLQPQQFELQHIALTDNDDSAEVSGQAHVNWADGISLSSNIAGDLFGEPVKLTSQLNADLPYLNVEQFEFRWLNTEVNANGRLAPGNQLAVNGRIAELGELPLISSNMSGQLNFDGVLEGSLDSLWADINLTSRQVTVAQQQLSDLTVSLQGSQQQQTVNTSFKHSLGALKLAVNNQLKDDIGRAVIKRFDLLPEDAQGELASLQRAVTINYNLDGSRVDTESFCLTHARFAQPACLDMQLDNQVVQLSLAAPSVPLSILNPVLATSSIELRGEASTDMKLSYDIEKKRLHDVRGKFKATDSSIKGLQESLLLDNIEILAQPVAETSNNGALLTLNAASRDVGLTANGRLELSSFAADGAINGAIDASLDDLKLLQIVIPTVSQVQGTAQASIDLSGTYSKPVVKPKASANIDQLLLTNTGTLITNTQLQVSQQQTANYHLQGTGTVGTGNFNIDGHYESDKEQLQATFAGEQLQLLDSPKLALTVSPDLQLSMVERNIDITGKVIVPQARITPPQLNSAVSPSNDVVIKQQQRQPEKELTTSANIDVRLGDQVNVSAFGFNGRLQGGLTISQQPRSVTRASGQIGVAKGTYEIYGQELTISQGQLIYNGGPIDNPGLNLQVVRNVPETPNAPDKIGAQVRGTLVQPELTLFSNPPMPDAHVLSYLLLGRAPNSTSESSNLELQAALLVSGDVTDAFTQGLKDTFGFDEVMLDSATNDVNDTSLYIGKYLSPRLYIKYGIGLIESTSSFFLRYQLTDNLWLESNSSTESQGGDLIYSIEK